ncbi:MAG: cation transporter [Flavobacteriia bacterium]|nr:cation transporter [Flavobacteriia bacterium]OIP45509.1 MAG: cation transporter [Flavobacteriaceae bacterium CG2_30_31_66]PIV96761.1 MAG: cation transporter [Flavobacteriaceae bacterium CG17_big_fil_post_rev_8_21_14_2_50_31_13]PIX12959.1 MAG: cation transporter [Flavobacteriaceae bacterium CG_4_8_14_3_um_filter_31_8]PIY14935.1 MAG: cation transporter [Flavobacteriaceae bacterium CG_4_10_14_3_um_filter_31_253]PIZ11627.1 MAG: cation transporter [Flavobacteriaceae bacterium CG_4_10_14_0_8_um_f
MAHDHSHTITNPNEINRSFLIGIALNVAYVVVEIIYGFSNNSTSLLSDAAHNVGDISGLLLAFLAFKLQVIKPSKIFSYGFKKGSIVTSFINSILLAFAIGAIAWEGFQKILNPSPLSGSVVMWVASIGVIINFASALLFKNKQKDDLNIKAAYWHLMADALVSLGVVFSGILIHYFQWYILDGITAIIIAVVVLFSTWNLFKDSAIAILDGVPNAIDPEEIKEHLLEVKGVKNIHHIHIWGISTNENAITAQIVVDNLLHLPQIKTSLKEELEEHNIKHSTLEFELTEENCTETCKQ